MENQKQQLLAAAVRSGDESVALDLLRGGHSTSNIVNTLYQPLQETVLHIACLRMHTKVVRILLRAGADTRIQDAFGETPLHKVRGNNATEIVRLLLDASAPVDAASTQGCTPLHSAAFKGCAGSLCLLLRAKANPEIQDRDGCTALHVAAANGNWECVKVLLEQRANAKATDWSNSTALHYSASCVPCEQVVELLLSHGTDPFARDKDKRTALDCATLRGNFSVVNMILQHYSSNIAARDCGIHNLLGDVTFNDLSQAVLPVGTIPMERFLALLIGITEANATLLGARDSVHGDFALHCACRVGAPVEVLQLLFEKGSNDQARNRAGETYLHVLVSQQTPPSQATLNFLLRAFPESIASCTQEGNVPLFLACEQSATPLEVINCLLRFSPTIVLTNQFPETKL